MVAEAKSLPPRVAAGTSALEALACGYSGFFPESFLQLNAAMKGFPDVRSNEALADRGVTGVVVPSVVAVRQVVEAASPARHRLRWSFGDAANGLDV